MAPSVAPATITISAWKDPVVEARGYTALSTYVEVFWLPVLGPSATLLLRRSAVFLMASPAGKTVTLEFLGTSLGLGKGEGRGAPLSRAVERCVRFGVAKHLATDRLAVRGSLSALPQRHLDRLNPTWQKMHRDWLEGER